MGVYFNGNNGYYLQANTVAMNVTNNFTMMAWALIPDTTAGGGIFIMGGNDNGYGFGHGGNTYDDTGSNMISIRVLLEWLASGANIGTGVWKHLTLVRESNTWKQYINNAQTPNTTSNNPVAPTNTTLIGREEGADGRACKAIVAECRCWDTVLTAAQRQNEMRSRIPVHQLANLKLWTPLENAAIPANYRDYAQSLAFSVNGSPTVDQHAPF